MSSEAGAARDGLVAQMAAAASDGAREFGHLHVRKFDDEQSSWVSRKLGGGRAGRRGFIQPTLRDFLRYRIRPYEELVSASNLITRAGWVRMLNLAFGIQSTGTYASATCRIGVGTATTAAGTGDTDLVAATGTAGRWWEMVTGAMATGTGTGSVGARASVTAAFGTGEANFPNPWQEWGIDVGAATGTGASSTPLLNRAVSNLGTKVAGTTWTATANLDFT